MGRLIAYVLHPDRLNSWSMLSNRPGKEWARILFDKHFDADARDAKKIWSYVDQLQATPRSLAMS